MRLEGIDKSRVCFSQQEDLSTEHFIELIGKRAADCEAWEGTLRSQGNLKDADKMRKTKEQLLRSLKRLNDINSRANK
jgi:phosphate-selective porin